MESSPYIRNQNCELLSTWLVQPERTQKAHTVLIFCHGFCATKEANFFPLLASATAAEGISYLGFDFSGSGRSEGKFEDSTVSKQVKDLLCVIKWCSVRYRNVFVGGHSLGGLVAAFGATELTSGTSLAVKGLVCVNAPAQGRLLKQLLGEDVCEIIRSRGLFEWSDGQQTFRITKQALEDLSRYDCVSQLKKVLCPSLICVAKDDEVIPASAGLGAIKASITKTVFCYSGDHNGSMPSARELTGRIVSWLKAQVATP